MNAAIKIDPNRLPVPKLPATPSIRPEPIPEGLTIIVVPLATPENRNPIPAPAKPKQKRPKKESSLWPEHKLNTLIALHNEGKTEKEIADEMGMKHSQIKSRLARLRAAGTIKKRKLPRGAWTEEEDGKLISLYREGRNAQEMSAEMGRTLHACESRIWKLRHAGKITDPLRANLSIRVHRSRGDSGRDAG